MKRISVIVCTHDPEASRLGRVLEALRAQSLALADWELLLVDNRSQTRLEPDLSWHPAARTVREDELGLTPARLRGIRETDGAVVVFVDDDNILQKDYLEVATAWMEEHPDIGVCGGSIEGEFSSPPPTWMSTHEFEMLAVRPIHDATFTAGTFDWDATPVGAGMLARREVADLYREETAANDERRSLDRRGRLLTSGGDIDIVRTALREGYRVGRIPELRLTHIIPASRLQIGYLCKLAEGMEFSNVVGHALQGKSYGNWLPKRTPRWALHYAASGKWRDRSPRARLERAAERGIRRGLRYVRQRLQ